MISITTILMGRDREYPLSDDLRNNLEDLYTKLVEFSKHCPLPIVISSGYRPGKYNTAVGGAKNSSHLTCQAVDLADSDKKIKEWCISHIDVLNRIGLYMEDPSRTPTWCHLQTRKTKNNPFKV